jgi:hypothetical protein
MNIYTHTHVHVHAHAHAHTHTHLHTLRGVHFNWRVSPVLHVLNGVRVRVCFQHTCRPAACVCTRWKTKWCKNNTASGTVQKQCVLGRGKCVVEAFLCSGKPRSVHSLLQLLQALETGTGQLPALMSVGTVKKLVSAH